MKGKTALKKLLNLSWVPMILFWAQQAFAAGGESGWRATYDQVLLWINFVIFAILIFKFGRKPLKIFLEGQKEEIERKMTRLEAEKKAAEAKVEELLKAVEESHIRFADIRQKIIEQGEKRKEQIIHDAQRQSKLMLEDARLKIDHQIYLARQALKAELVDAAVAQAIERLPAEITPSDSQNFISHYLTAVVQKKPAGASKRL